MEVKDLKVGFNTVLSIAIGIVSSMTVFFTLQGSVNEQGIRIQNLETEKQSNKEEFKDVHAEYKELTKTLNNFKYDILNAINKRK